MLTCLRQSIVLLASCLILTGCGDKVSLTSSTVDPATSTATIEVSTTSGNTATTKPNSDPTTVVSSLPVVDDRLTLEYEPENEPPDEINVLRPLHVRLTNHSNQSIRILHPDLPRGFDRISFQFTNPRTGAVFAVHAQPAATGNVSVTESAPVDTGVEVIDIGLGESVVFEIEFCDFNEHQSWAGLPVPNSGESLSMTVAFQANSPPNVPPRTAQDDSRPRLWTGRISTLPIPVKLVAPQWSTPQDYLKGGFTERAIELIENDPELISSRDERRRTPLHLAVLRSHAKSVKWLIDHGADVDAIDINGDTPLHLAQSPQIVGLLLERKPDLRIRDKISNQTPLQRSVDRLFEPSSRQGETWREIVSLYLSAGADVDLLSAIRLGDLDRVKALLKKSPGDADEYQNQSPLRVAAAMGHLEICQYLIDEFQVDVNDLDSGHGYPILKDALAFPRVVQLLVHSGADVKSRINWRARRGEHVEIMCDNGTILHYAARDGIPETIALLVAAEVDMFATARNFVGTRSEPTALEVAAYYGRVENAVAILQQSAFSSADPALVQSLLNKSLAIAAPAFWLTEGAKRAELFKVLLERGADPNSHLERGSVLQTVARQIRPGRDPQNSEIVQALTALKDHGAEVDLFSAVALGDLERVQQMVNQTPSLAIARSYDGYPALHMAIELNHWKIVEALLKAGCDVDIRNESRSGPKGGTALHCAAARGRFRIVRQLIDAHADVNSVSDEALTPLHVAAGSARVRSTRLLLEKGAHADAVDAQGRTPLDLFRQNYRNVPEMERLLRAPKTASSQVQ